MDLSSFAMTLYMVSAAQRFTVGQVKPKHLISDTSKSKQKSHLCLFLYLYCMDAFACLVTDRFSQCQLTKKNVALFSTQYTRLCLSC